MGSGRAKRDIIRVCSRCGEARYVGLAIRTANRKRLSEIERWKRCFKQRPYVNSEMRRFVPLAVIILLIVLGGAIVARRVIDEEATYERESQSPEATSLSPGIPSTGTAAAGSPAPYSPPAAGAAISSEARTRTTV
jgi:hypothetical protein